MEIPIRSASGAVAHDPKIEHRGPSLLGLAIVVTVLFVGSLILTALMTHGGHIPSPFEPASATAGFFAEQATALRLNAFLQLGGALVFGNFAAASVSRLRFLGARVAGVHIALFGGIASAIFAAIAGLLLWVLTQPEIATDAGVVHLMHLLLFAMGGVGHVAAAGLLLAGVSLSAGLLRLLPRWIMWLGLIFAAISELSTLTLLTQDAAYLLPIARLGTLAWMIAVGASLPKSAGAIQNADHIEREPVLARVPTG